MSDLERFIDTAEVQRFCDILKKSDAKFRGYFKRTFWDNETEKGFIVNVDTKDDQSVNRRRDYFIATVEVDGKMRLGKMEVLAEEVLHDYAVQCAMEGRGGGIANTVIMSSLASSDKFELINENTNFYDFVKCFCK